MNKANIPCEECHRLHRDFFQKPLPCRECPKPFLDPQNQTAWELFHILATQPRMGGMGGFLGLDFSCLSTVFDAWDIEKCERRFLIEKLTTISSVAVKYWNPETPKSNSRPKSEEKGLEE